jgi:NADH dehydrogenase
MNKKPHIIIIGAGFGGVYTAKYLGRKLGKIEADITVISRDNYFLFTPLLHEVATGSLSHQSIIEPIVEIFRRKNIHFIQGEVRHIDPEVKTVETDGWSFSYDYLVISSGAETNTYGIKGVAEHTIKLKTLSDALALRKRIIESIKKASHTDDQVERKHLLSFIIVGGGPTGVELAAELDEFVFQVAKSYYATALSAHEISITLIASSADLLPQFSPQVRSKALSVLSKKGIEVLLNRTVLEVSKDGVSTKGGLSTKDDQSSSNFIPAGTIIWVAGVEASLPEMNGENHIHKSGRLMVNEYLEVEGHTEVFALGDAAILPIKEGQLPVPQLAQTAVQEAKIVAENISTLIKYNRNCTSNSSLSTSPQSSEYSPRTQLKYFTYRSKGMLVSLGSWQAAGDIFGLHPSGPLMWFLWRTVYLFKFTPWRKRFSIMFEWTINLFTPRDISEI